MSRNNQGVATHHARRNRAAFTLVELLVVVGVIAVLLALLMPTLARARDHARRVACLSNLRSLTAAWLLYADNHRGRLCRALPGAADRPGFHDWVAAGFDEQSLRDGVLWPYVNAAGVYRCPADVVNASHTYLINSWLNGEGPPAWGEAMPAQSLSRVRQASETFVFLENLDPYGCNDRSFRVPPFPSRDWTDLPADGLHGRVGLISFADGHAIVWNWVGPHHWHRAMPPGETPTIDSDLEQAQRWIGHGPYPPWRGAQPN
jgi:prepilin-type N-terminal cleavage/methylation domain-containing protein